MTHVMLPSFHWTRISHPFIVSFRRFVLVMKGSCCFTSVPSVL
jgi:hypothetical protein